MRHRGRRSSKKNSKRAKELKIFYNNINGYQTKENSLKMIVKDTSPDIIALCETKRPTGSKKEIDGYAVRERNLKQGQEGFLVAVKEGSFKKMDDVTESELRNIMTVRIEFPEMTVRLIIVHAPQETEKLETRTDFFDEVATQIERGNTSSETVIVLGDFNAKINNEFSTSTVSSNGKLMLEMIDEYNMKICNFSEKAEGKWTRIAQGNDGLVKKSVLDYVLLENDMYSMMTEMVVDEERFFCPYRQKKVQGTNRTIFSDHRPIIVKLAVDIGEVKGRRKQRKVWNFNDDSGYVKFEHESESDLTVEECESSTETYSMWAKNFEKLLYKCFTKKTIREGHRVQPTRHRYVRAKLKKIGKQGKVQREIVKKFMERLIEIEARQQAAKRADRLKNTMSMLSTADKLSPTGYWEMIKGSREEAQTRCRNNNNNSNRRRGTENWGERSDRSIQK